MKKFIFQIIFWSLTLILPRHSYGQGDFLELKKIDAKMRVNQTNKPVFNMVSKPDTLQKLVNISSISSSNAYKVLINNKPEKKTKNGSTSQYEKKYDTLLTAYIDVIRHTLLLTYDTLKNSRDQLLINVNTIKNDTAHLLSNFVFKSSDSLMLQTLLSYQIKKEKENTLKIDENKKVLDTLIENINLQIRLKPDDLKNEISKIDTNLNSAKNLINNCNEMIDEINTSRKKLWEEYKKSSTAADDSTSDNSSAIDNFISLISPLTSAQIIPNITVKASTAQYSSENNTFQFVGCIFLGAGLATFSDSSKTSDTYNKLSKNLWIADASALGVRLKFLDLFALGDKAKEGFNFEANFLSKNIPLLNDSSKISGGKYIDFAHIVAGLNFELYKNSLGVYANLNYLTPLDNIGQFNSYFGTKNQPGWFWVDFGISLDMTIAKSENHILLNLDMISNSPLKNITRTDDLFLPVIKVSYKPSLK